MAAPGRIPCLIIRPLAIFLLLFLVAPGPGQNANSEHRRFVILVDGKEAGHSDMTITRQNDGTTMMSAKASVKVHQAVFKYTFEVQATEQWKDGRLVSLKCTTNDNGRRIDVSATSDAQRLRLRVNGSERHARPEAWINSYWKLPDAKFHNNHVPVIEADTGKEVMNRLQYIGTEQITISGQPEPCYHFRVTGSNNPVDLWFDRYHLLVRQEFIEAGHRTVVQVKSIHR